MGIAGRQEPSSSAPRRRRDLAERADFYYWHGATDDQPACLLCYCQSGLADSVSDLVAVNRPYLYRCHDRHFVARQRSQDGPATFGLDYRAILWRVFWTGGGHSGAWSDLYADRGRDSGGSGAAGCLGHDADFSARGDLDPLEMIYSSGLSIL